MIMHKKILFFIILYTIICITLHNNIYKKNYHFIVYYSLHTIIFTLHNNLIKKIIQQNIFIKIKKNIYVFHILSTHNENCARQ